MKKGSQLRMIVGATAAALTLIACGSAQKDLPIDHPTKISKLHNLRQRQEGTAASGAAGTAPTTAPPAPN